MIVATTRSPCFPPDTPEIQTPSHHRAIETTKPPPAQRGPASVEDDIVRGGYFRTRIEYIMSLAVDGAMATD